MTASISPGPLIRSDKLTPNAEVRLRRSSRKLVGESLRIVNRLWKHADALCCELWWANRDLKVAREGYAQLAQEGAYYRQRISQLYGMLTPEQRQKLHDMDYRLYLERWGHADE